MLEAGRGWRSARERLNSIIFGHETPEGKAFDVVLLILIVLSVLVVMLESISTITGPYREALRILEWIVTLAFTVEYILRLLTAESSFRYLWSFYGLVDLVSFLPTYLSLLIPGSQSLATVRTLRLLRVFRVLKLVEYVREASQLSRALRASARKIIVFLGTVLAVVTIMGSLMYLVEGGENGFTSIPRSVYWAVVTLTTVGYGDIAPHTAPGQFISAVVMILGYAILAVPTGIVSVELARERGPLRHCSGCGKDEHDAAANFCKHCGERL